MSKKAISESSVSDLLGYLSILQNLQAESSKMLGDLQAMVAQGQFKEGGLSFLTKERESLETKNGLVSKKITELRAEVDMRFKGSLELDFAPGDLDVLFHAIQDKVQRKLTSLATETNPLKANRPIRKINPKATSKRKATTKKK